MQGRKELKSLPERRNVSRGADWGGEGRSSEFLLGWMSWAGDHLLPSSLGLHHCAVLSQQLSRIHILLYHRAHVSHSRVTLWVGVQGLLGAHPLGLGCDNFPVTLWSL